jgi:hypothetical protein
MKYFSQVAEKRRVAMSQNHTGIKRIVEAAVTTVTSPPRGVRGPLRGRDFMLDDLTYDADHDGH